MISYNELTNKWYSVPYNGTEMKGVFVMLRRLFLIGAAFLVCSSLVFAGGERETDGQELDYPSRPVRVIVGYGPGGGNDLTSRVLLREVSESLGQPFNVENIPGASGTVAAAVAASAPADGYNLFFTVTDTTAVQPNLIDVNFSLDDFRGIAGFSYEPSVIAVRTDSPWETFEDLLAEENSGIVLDRGHSGIGGVAYILLELLFDQVAIETRDIPFEGGAAAISALLGGHIDIIAGTGGAMVPYIESGEIRVLAAAADERLEAFPDVPTFKEKGYDISVGVEFFMVAPKDVPDEIMAILEEEVMKAAQSDAFAAFVEERRQQLIIRTGDEILEKTRSDYEMFKALLQ